MNTVTIEERGWPGHFCCASRCRFRRNTLLTCKETKTRIVVSTVGNMMVRKGDTHETEEIGLDRYYETAVFHAEYDGHYWDADIYRLISIDGLNWSIGKLYDGVDNDANEMHEAHVREVARRLAEGDTFKERIDDEQEQIQNRRQSDS